MALKLHADFSEGSGTTTANAAKPSHVGTLRGTTLPSWQSGAYSPTAGNWLDFNGEEGGAVVEFPEDAFTTITGAISIAAHVKTPQTFPGAPATYAQKEIVARGGGRLTLGWEEDAVENFVWLRCYIRAADSDYFELEWRDDNPQPGYRDDEWHSIVVRFVPSSASDQDDGRAELWVDGVLRDAEVHSIDELAVSSVEDLWAIGGRVNTTTKAIDRNLDAAIQDVRIYDHWLADWEIADMAVKTKAQLLAQIASLFADNVAGDISAEDLRTGVGDMVDSLSIEGIPERSANGAQYRVVALEEDISGLSGGSVNSTIEVPAGGKLLAVSAVVTTLIEGPTTFSLRYLSQEPKAPSRFRGCLCRLLSASGTIAAGTGSYIDWTTEDYDTDGFHDNSTNRSRITIPAGSNITKVRLFAAFRGSVWTAGKIGIFKNGAVGNGLPEQAADRVDGASNDGQWSCVSAVVECSPGDYFQMRAWNDEASGKSVSADGRSYFGMEVVEEVEEDVVSGIAVAADTEGAAVVESVPVAAATKIQLVGDDGSFTAGAVRLALFYRAVTAPSAS